jgi:hypothetical protein
MSVTFAVHDDVRGFPTLIRTARIVETPIHPKCPTAGAATDQVERHAQLLSTSPPSKDVDMD